MGPKTSPTLAENAASSYSFKKEPRSVSPTSPPLGAEAKSSECFLIISSKETSPPTTLSKREETNSKETFKVFNIQNLDYKVYNSIIIKINELFSIINVYRL